MKQIIFRLSTAFILLLNLSLLVQGQGLEDVRQWASKALATSQYSDEQGWQASQATGEPDTETCGDFPTAWASATSTGQDTLTVFFTQPVFPTQINIHQSFNPGAITSVTLLPEDGSDPIELEDSADTETEDCPGVFTLDIETGMPQIKGIEIALDQTITNDWNEIDAVELVGLALPDGMELPRTGADPDSDDDTEEIASEPIALPTETGTEPDGASDPSEYIQPGYAINCDTTFGDASFNNGTEFFMRLPNGNRFTFTAVGIGDFDPVIAILDPSNYGTCSDDNSDAATYGARLPTTGDVPPSTRSAQLVLDVEYFEPMVPYTVVVGSRNSMPGEFLLFIEGGFSERSDGIGDIYSMKTSPGMIASSVNPTAYMIGIVQAFDAYIYLVDNESNQLVDQDSKSYIACDDAGSRCYGTSHSMVGAAASRSGGRAVGGGSLDAMMTLPLDPGDENFWLNYVMLGNRTFGDYMTVFHVGVGDPNE